MIKIAFFDVDGTLLKLGTKELSDKTKKALTKLRQNNVLLTWTVVKLGVTIFAGSISSNPAIATSSGTIYPCSCNTFIKIKKIYIQSLWRYQKNQMH